MILRHLWGGDKYPVCLGRIQGKVATLRVVPQACNCFIYVICWRIEITWFRVDVKRRIVRMLITVTLTLTLEVGDVEVENNKKASSNNIMERRAQPNGTIMASKRVEIGLVFEACPIVPPPIYFVRLPSPPLAYFLDCLLSSWWDKAFNILLT